jgi:hypothetical protein
MDLLKLLGTKYHRRGNKTAAFDHVMSGVLVAIAVLECGDYFNSELIRKSFDTDCPLTTSVGRLPHKYEMMLPGTRRRQINAGAAETSLTMTLGRRNGEKTGSSFEKLRVA